MPVKTETFRELWAPLVHTNFRGNSYGPIIGPYLFMGKFVWTNGPESSSKVSPYTGIGPWRALSRSGGKEAFLSAGRSALLWPWCFAVAIETLLSIFRGQGPLDVLWNDITTKQFSGHPEITREHRRFFESFLVLLFSYEAFSVRKYVGQIKPLKGVSQGRANHEVQTVNWNTGIFEAERA